MNAEEREILLLVEQLADGCRRHPQSRAWTERFERDARRLQTALDAGDRDQTLRVLTDVRQGLWGGMGAFCDGGAPTPELEELGNRVYRLVLCLSK